MASVNEETGSGYYSQGNEAFVAENYSSAIDLYTAALGIDPLFADCLVARAHAYIKSDKFEQAKEDADKSIQILPGSQLKHLIKDLPSIWGCILSFWKVQ